MPQGGIASPTIFKFYLTDLPIPIDKNEDGAAFADDLSSWGTGYNATQATTSTQFFLNGFQAWSQCWRIIQEPSKSSTILFSGNPLLRKQPYSLTLLGEKIPQVDKVTFLGVDLYASMSWKSNTDKITSKALSAIYQVKKLVPIFGKSDPLVVHEVYNSLFTSILAYLVPANVNRSTNQWEKIETMQNKVLRTIHSIPPKISTELLFKTTGEKRIREHLEEQACKRIHKILDNTAGISKYLWDYKRHQDVKKYPSLLNFHMSNDLTPFTNHFKCPLCCFKINHACSIPPELAPDQVEGV